MHTSQTYNSQEGNLFGRRILKKWSEMDSMLRNHIASTVRIYTFIYIYIYVWEGTVLTNFETTCAPRLKVDVPSPKPGSYPRLLLAPRVLRLFLKNSNDAALWILQYHVEPGSFVPLYYTIPCRDRHLRAIVLITQYHVEPGSSVPLYYIIPCRARELRATVLYSAT